MMRSTVAGTWFLVVAVVLAGCATSQDAQPIPASSSAQREPAHAPPAQAPADEATGESGDDRGAIEGRIVNDELLPVKGAFATLLPGGAEVESDDKGSFVFSQVAVGQYQVRVAAVGYAGVVLDVAVTKGEVAELRITLKPALTGEAHYQLDEFQGHIEYVVVAKSAVGLGGFASAGVSHYFALNDRPEVIDEALLEIDWESTTPADGGLRVFLRARGETLTWCLAEGKAPFISCQINATVVAQTIQNGWTCTVAAEGTEACEIGWSASTGYLTDTGVYDVGAAVDQNFTVYTTTFYRQAMPSGYTATQ